MKIQDSHPSSLTRRTLTGVWPALLTPWTEDDEIDVVRLAQEIEHFAAVGVNGLYTGGTAGEFYAQDDAVFAQLTRTVCQRGREAGIAVQIGCTALSTRTATSRVRVAVESGADGIQFALPFWLALRDEEVVEFFGAVSAAAGETPMIFYQTLRAKRRVDPPLIGQLTRMFPAFIGMKDTACDLSMLAAIRADAPDLSIFGTDIDLSQRMQLGTRGSYSSMAGLNARYMLDLHRLCAEGRFDEAHSMQLIVRRVMDEVLIPMCRDEGLCDSAVDRVQRAVSGGDRWLRCQGPYRAATAEHSQRLRRWCEQHAPILLEG